MNGRQLGLFAHFAQKLHTFVQLVELLGGVITNILSKQQNKKINGRLKRRTAQR